MRCFESIIPSTCTPSTAQPPSLIPPPPESLQRKDLDDLVHKYYATCRQTRLGGATAPACWGRVLPWGTNGCWGWALGGCQGFQRLSPPCPLPETPTTPTLPLLTPTSPVISLPSPDDFSHPPLGPASYPMQPTLPTLLHPHPSLTPLSLSRPPPTHTPGTLMSCMLSCPQRVPRVPSQSGRQTYSSSTWVQASYSLSPCVMPPHCLPAAASHVIGVPHLLCPSRSVAIARSN